MRGYYIIPDIKEREVGIYKKINYHIRLFSEFSTVKLLRVKSKSYIINKLWFRLPFTSTSSDYDTVFEQLDHPDYIYIRKGALDRKFIKFISKVSIAYPKCKLILEIPTYPYDNDILNLPRNFFILKKDRRIRKEISRYIDRIVTYSDDDVIFGCATIKAHNAVDCKNISPNTDFSLVDNEIRMIGVAQFRPQHGYERLIKGMGAYYNGEQSKKVSLVLVGEGPELPMYKELAERERVSKYIEFTGSLTGYELEKKYNNSDVAISSLGMYKLGLEYVSTLKNCEYLAKGLPIVAGYDDYVLQNNRYSLRVKNDDSEINIEEIVSFYEDVYIDGKEQVIENVRGIAFHRADIKQAYKDVISYMLEQTQ